MHFDLDLLVKLLVKLLRELSVPWAVRVVCRAFLCKSCQSLLTELPTSTGQLVLQFVSYWEFFDAATPVDLEIS